MIQQLIESCNTETVIMRQHSTLQQQKINCAMKCHLIPDPTEQQPSTRLRALHTNKQINVLSYSSCSKQHMILEKMPHSYSIT